MQTIQKTGKRWKFQKLLAVGAITAGIVMLAGADGDSSKVGPGAMLIVIGLVWLLVVSFLAWWHHG